MFASSFRFSLFLALSIASWTQTLRAQTAPSPADVLRLSRLSRGDFIMVTGQVEAFAPTFRSSQESYPYLLILDEIQTIAEGYGLQSFGANPVKVMAIAVTRSALKWIRIDVDDINVLSAFFKWGEDDVRYDAADLQARYLQRAVTLAELTQWYDRIALVLSWTRPLNMAVFVVAALEDIQGTAADRFVPFMIQMTEAEVVRFIRSTQTSTALQALVAGWEQQVLQSNDNAYLKRLYGWCLVYGTHVQSLSIPVSRSVRYAAGPVIVAISEKLLSSGDQTDASLADQTVNVLSDEQSIDLGSRILQSVRPGVRPSQVESLWAIGRRLYAKYQSLGLVNESTQMQALLNRLAVMRLSQYRDFEGSYAMTIGNFRGTMTIANTGDANFIVGLTFNAPTFPLHYSLFNVTYNFDDDTFEAHRFSVDDPRYVMPNWPNWYMKFKFIDQGNDLGVEGQFSDTVQIYRVHAARYDKYEKFPNPRSLILGDMTGVYQSSGTISGHPVRLVITQVGLKLSGTISWGASRVDLVYGYYNRDRKVFSITTAELDSGRWTQIRGQWRSQTEFVGDYIIGGEGEKFTQQTFTLQP